jgi:tetratricopeptide (TPR) repeat protein
MVRTPRPFTIPAQKAKSTFRIFVLGESAAYGDPDPAYGFSRYLEVMLRERYPGIKFEVINAGITAIDSHVVLPIAEDLSRRQPDLFIIYTGNNEVVGPYGPGTVFTSSALNIHAIRASIFLHSTRLGQLITNALRSKEQKAQEWAGMELFLDQQIRADSPMMPHVYDNLRANLEDMVEAAQRRGAKVILSTVGVNLKDCAPFGSLHREDLSQDQLAKWSASAQRGVALENTGAYAEALKIYRDAEKIDSSYAELQFRIARCLWALGDYAASEERFQRARDLDTLRFRTDSREEEVIRSVATKKGVALLDATALFSGASPHGVAGSELFYDHVHMSPEGNYLLAQALFERVTQMLPENGPGNGAGNAPPTRKECEQLLAFTPFDKSRVDADMFYRLQKPPFTNQANHFEQLLNLRLAMGATTATYADTVARYEWALRKHPDDRMLHLKYSNLLMESDPAAAAQELRSARPYDGFPLMLPNGTRID